MPELLGAEEISETATRREQQHHFAKFTFDFYDKYFRSDCRAIGYGRPKTNIDYTRLPARPAIKKVHLFKSRPFTAISLAFAFAVATADCLLDPSGTGDGWWLAPELFLIGLATMFNFFRFHVWQVLPSVFVEADQGGDGTMLWELEGRRVAALRRLAEPDPLSTLEEHAATLAKLKAAGAITEEEVARYSELATVANIPELDHLADTVVPEEAPHQTLH